MAEILKGEESVDKKVSLDELGDTNFKKLVAREMGSDKKQEDEKVDLVNGVPVRIYRL